MQYLLLIAQQLEEPKWLAVLLGPPRRPCCREANSESSDPPFDNGSKLTQTPKSDDSFIHSLPSQLHLTIIPLPFP